MIVGQPDYRRLRVLLALVTGRQLSYQAVKAGIFAEGVPSGIQHQFSVSYRPGVSSRISNCSIAKLGLRGNLRSLHLLPAVLQLPLSLPYTALLKRLWGHRRTRTFLIYETLSWL